METMRTTTTTQEGTLESALDNPNTVEQPIQTEWQRFSKYILDFAKGKATAEDISYYDKKGAAFNFDSGFASQNDAIVAAMYLIQLVPVACPFRGVYTIAGKQIRIPTLCNLNPGHGLIECLREAAVQFLKSVDIIIDDDCSKLIEVARIPELVGLSFALAASENQEDVLPKIFYIINRALRKNQLAEINSKPKV